MKPSISEILRAIEKESNSVVKVQILRMNDSPALREILKYGFEPSIKWLLPAGAPPYSKSEEVGSETRLFAEARKLYLFVLGGNPNLDQVRREQLFITLLETIHPNDAEILVELKDKKYQGLNGYIINNAFPGLLNIEVNPKKGGKEMEPTVVTEKKSRTLREDDPRRQPRSQEWKDKIAAGQKVAHARRKAAKELDKKAEDVQSKNWEKESVDQKPVA